MTKMSAEERRGNCVFGSFLCGRSYSKTISPARQNEGIDGDRITKKILGSYKGKWKPIQAIGNPSHLPHNASSLLLACL